MSVVSLYWTAEREVGQGRLSYSVRPDDGADHARAQVAVVCRRYVAIGGHLGRTLVGPVDVGELMLGGSRPGVDARKISMASKIISLQKCRWGTECQREGRYGISVLVVWSG